MTRRVTGTVPEHRAIDTSSLELSVIVGRPVILYSDQFPGRPLRSRAIEASGNVIAVDRGGPERLVDNLVNNQKITVRFEYKGEQMSIPALLKRTAGGKCNIILGDNAVPLARRFYERIDLSLPIKLAVFPVSTFDIKKMARLRWLQSDTVNFSSGGVLVELTSRLETRTHLFINIEPDGFSFPSLVIGQTRYCHQIESGQFHSGVEFVVDETKGKHFSLSTLRALPAVVFDYTSAKRARLNSEIVAWMQTDKKRGTQ